MAVLVNVRQSWPAASTPAQAAASVLGEWSGLSDDGLRDNADIVIALAPDETGQEVVVAVMDVVPDGNGHGWTRTAGNLVVFNGIPSARYAYLVGHPWPESVFSVQGMARPARYWPTSRVPAPLAP
jgi:hypothetical protein